MVNLLQSLFNEVFVAKGERIGVHDNDASCQGFLDYALRALLAMTGGGKGTQAVTVLPEAPAVFKKDGFGGFSKDVEAKAFKDCPVLRFGEDLEVAAAGNDA